MKDFLRWVENLSHRFDYKYPANPVHRVFDFYALSLLYKGPYQKGQEWDREGEIRMLTEEVANTLLPALRDALLNEMFIGILGEIRYGFLGKYNFDWNETSGVPPIIAKIAPEFAQYYTKKVEWYNKNHDDPNAMPANVEGSYMRQEVMHDLRDTYEKMVMSKANSVDKGAIVKWVVSTDYFNAEPANWEHMYGGEPWKQIADGWLRLQSAQDIPDMFAYIDHCFDLQHNTGSVLNKSADWNTSHDVERVSGTDWIGAALELKKHTRSVLDFVEFVSPPMKQLILRANKMPESPGYDRFVPTYNKVQNHPQNYNDLRGLVKQRLNDREQWTDREDWTQRPSPESHEDDFKIRFLKSVF